jgi:hypothetical protein
MADRSLAHLDTRGFDGLVRFDDLNASIDAFDELVCKYLKLLRGCGYATLEPVVLYDWDRIFFQYLLIFASLKIDSAIACT